MWLFGRRLCKGVEAASAKALRKESAGGIRRTARKPARLEQSEQGGIVGGEVRELGRAEFRY